MSFLNTSNLIGTNIQNQSAGEVISEANDALSRDSNGDVDVNVDDIDASGDVTIVGTLSAGSVTISGTSIDVDEINEKTTSNGIQMNHQTTHVAGSIDSTTTADRLLSTNSSKELTSTDLNSWVDGTTNQVTVTDDTDGTITLSLPQDIDTGATVQFNIAQLTTGVDAPQYTNSSGNISIDAQNTVAQSTISLTNSDGTYDTLVTADNLTCSGTLITDTINSSGGDITINTNMTITSDGRLTITDDTFPVLNFERTTALTSGGLTTLTGLASTSRCMTTSSSAIGTGFGGGITFVITGSNQAETVLSRMYSRVESGTDVGCFQLWNKDGTTDQITSHHGIALHSWYLTDGTEYMKLTTSGLFIDKITELTGSNGVNIEDLNITDTTISNSAGDITIDCVNTSADSTLTITNSDGTYECNVDIEGDLTVNGTLNLPTSITVNNINESTTDAGVNIEGSHFENSKIAVGVGVESAYSALKLYGIYGSATVQAGWECSTTNDVYPLLHCLPYTHDDVYLNFDAYWDSAGIWRSSSLNGNFTIHKDTTVVEFMYDSGVAQGSMLSWNVGLKMNLTDGLLTSSQTYSNDIGGTAGRVMFMKSSGEMGTNSNALSCKTTDELLAPQTYGNDIGGTAGRVMFMKSDGEIGTNSNALSCKTTDELLAPQTYGNDIGGTAGRVMFMKSDGEIGTNSNALNCTTTDQLVAQQTYTNSLSGSSSRFLLAKSDGEMGTVDLALETDASDVLYSVNSYTNINTSGTIKALTIDDRGEIGISDATSLLKYKTNVEDLTDISWIYKLNVVSFNFRKPIYNKEGLRTGKYSNDYHDIKYHGLIADDFVKIKPDLCVYDDVIDQPDKDCDKCNCKDVTKRFKKKCSCYKHKELSGIRYEQFTPILIKIVQEQKNLIDSQQKLINDLQSRVSILEDTVFPK